ncbi:MAG: hypothetical protein R3E12_07760 [Candidatus Eisenbacteria bacterium]
MAVLGLARSGWAAASLLAARTAARLLLLDRAPGASTEEKMSVLRRSARAVDLRAGEHDAHWLDEIDLIIKSPGVDPRVPFVQAAVHAGVPVVRGAGAGCRSPPAVPSAAISGTNGKSLTTAWTGDMLRRSGVAVQVVGNIGRPICEGAGGSGGVRGGGLQLPARTRPVASTVARPL